METATLQNIIDHAKYRADMVNTDFIEDPEWLVYAIKSAKWYYDKLVQADEEYFLTSATIAVDGTEDTYALPSTFYKLKGVDYQVGGNTVAMEKYQFAQRNQYEYRTQKVRYRLVGTNIVFAPVPSAQTITLWYVPTLALSSASDTILSVNGWDEFVALDVAIKALDKEESDSQALRAERDIHIQRLEEIKNNRDLGAPERVSDVSRLDIMDIESIY